MGKLTDIEAKLRQNPEDAGLWLEKGLELVAANQHYEAIEAYSTGLSLEPENPVLHMSRGRRYISLQRFAEALADLAAAARLQPENFDNWYYQAVAYALSDKYPQAVAAMEKCREVVLKGSDEALRAPVADWLWLLNMRLNRKEAAAAALDMVSAETPELTVAPSYKKIALLYKGLLAPETFEDESLLTSADPRALLYYITEVYCLANYYYVNGNSDNSNRLLRKLKGIDKHHYTFAYMLAEKDMALRGI
jgi:tetratricopeptide (TPR) repeat protein